MSTGRVRLQSDQMKIINVTARAHLGKTIDIDKVLKEFKKYALPNESHRNVGFLYVRMKSPINDFVMFNIFRDGTVQVMEAPSETAVQESWNVLKPLLAPGAKHRKVRNPVKNRRKVKRVQQPVASSAEASVSPMQITSPAVLQPGEPIFNLGNDGKLQPIHSDTSVCNELDLPSTPLHFEFGQI